MTRFLGAALAMAFILTSVGLVRADDKDPKAILDKAIKALGGEEKLAKATAFSWKSKGTITVNGNDLEFTGKATAQGLDRLRNEIESDQFQGVTVLNGDKAWRKFGDNLMELDGDALAAQKRYTLLQLISITLVPLKGKDYKLEAAGEEKVDGKTAVGVKATGSDGKDFTIHFDQESGLPVKLTAKVAGFQGEEVTQESTFTDYKDFDGIKKSTKTETKRDGQTFLKGELSDFKVLDKVDPETFAEPK